MRLSRLHAVVGIGCAPVPTAVDPAAAAHYRETCLAQIGRWFGSVSRSMPRRRIKHTPVAVLVTAQRLWVRP